jgi:chromatin segregation and condensation protein Rec8/ScpA/Scc1 (kleisin family)
LIADQLKLCYPVARVFAWYQKSHVTFSDLFREMRKLIWRERYFSNASEKSEPVEISLEESIASVVDQLAATG